MMPQEVPTFLAVIDDPVLIFYVSDFAYRLSECAGQSSPPPPPRALIFESASLRHRHRRIA